MLMGSCVLSGRVFRLAGAAHRRRQANKRDRGGGRSEEKPAKTQGKPPEDPGGESPPDNLGRRAAFGPSRTGRARSGRRAGLLPPCRPSDPPGTEAARARRGGVFPSRFSGFSLSGHRQALPILCLGTPSPQFTRKEATSMRSKRTWIAVAVTANLLLLPLVLAAPAEARAGPLRAGRRSERRSGGSGDRGLVPESVAAPSDDPLDHLRCSGLI